MTYDYRRLLTLIGIGLVVSAGAMIAQDLDADGLIVAEDMLIDEATSGETEKKVAPPVLELPGVDLDDAALTDLLPADDTAPKTEPAETPAPVAEPTAVLDALGIEALEEVPVTEAPAPVVEAAPLAADDLLELPALAEPAVEIPAVEEPVAEAIPEGVAEEKGAPQGLDVSALEDDVTLKAEPLIDMGEELNLPETKKPAATEPALETWEDAVSEARATDAKPKDQVEDAPSDLALDAPVPAKPADDLLDLPPLDTPEPAQKDEVVETAVEEIPLEEEPVVAKPAKETDLFSEAFGEAVREGVEPPPALPAKGVEVPQEPGWAEQPAEAAARAPVVAPKTAVTVGLLEEQEVMRRGAIEQYASERVEIAEKLLRRQLYREAVEQFENALNAMESVGKRPENEEVRRRIRDGLRMAYYRWADQLRKDGDIEQAEKVAIRARDNGHPDASRLIGQIKTDKEGPKEPIRPPSPKLRWRQEDFKKQQESISARIRQGREFFATGELEEAQAVFEGILADDPYNTEAIRWLQKVAQREYDVASSEFNMTRQRMMADGRDTWNPRSYDITGVDIPGPVIGGGAKRPVMTDQKRILDKMASIEIPEIDFRQANINDVIQFLQDASREFDNPQLPERDRGVNLILNLQAGSGGGAAAAAPAAADPFGGAAGAGFDTGGEVPLITFNARHVSLQEALGIVTQVAGLKYHVRGKVVMIVPIDAATEDMNTRVYDVLPSVAERVSSAGEELGGGSRGGDTGGFTALETVSAGSEYADWKETFRAMGVNWPAGSSIRHVPTIGKLIVKNTPDNLMAVEDVLQMLNVVPKQIEIEARFVEVSQTDLDSVGVEWMLTDDWELASKKNAGGPIGSTEKIVMRNNAANGGFTTGLRYLQDGVGAAGTVVGDSVFSIGGVLTNPELTAILHLLSQKGSADLLSAPKVTTQNETEASIKVVTEYIYPTDFAVTPVTATDINGNSTIAGGVVEPSSFETREVGVILSVVPRLSPEGQMIELTMSPEVVSDPEWYEYGSVYTDANGNTQRLNMQQPFFHTRSISTTISIYNGATVMMGGMITENRNSVEDKIPILGDIPIIGRLFQSRYEHSDKRNLLIFVTARLVDPAGRFTSVAQDQALGDKLREAEGGAPN